MRKGLISFSTLAAGAALALCVAADKPKAVDLAVGAPAPSFGLQNQDGKTVSLNDFSGKVLVLEWTNPECPFVQAHYKAHTMTDLVKKYQPEGVAWVAINSTHGVTNAYDKQWATQQGLPYPILNDASGKIGHAYGATNTPEMYIINKDGKVVYEGAIDNDRDGDKGSAKINYVDQGLSEVLAGKPVSVPQTKAYGCTVKYAD